MIEEKKYWLDRKSSVDMIFYGLCVLCAGVILVGPLLISGSETHFGWEGWFGFYGVYGFVACFLLVLAARGVRTLLKRREDYYDG
jgi:hypothetical protein